MYRTVSVFTVAELEMCSPSISPHMYGSMVAVFGIVRKLRVGKMVLENISDNIVEEMVSNEVSTEEGSVDQSLFDRVSKGDSRVAVDKECGRRRVSEWVLAGISEVVPSTPSVVNDDAGVFESIGGSSTITVLNESSDEQSNVREDTTDDSCCSNECRGCSRDDVIHQSSSSKKQKKWRRVRRILKLFTCCVQQKYDE